MVVGLEVLWMGMGIDLERDTSKKYRNCSRPPYLLNETPTPKIEFHLHFNVLRLDYGRSLLNIEYGMRREPKAGVLSGECAGCSQTQNADNTTSRHNELLV